MEGTGSSLQTPWDSGATWVGSHPGSLHIQLRQSPPALGEGETRPTPPGQASHPGPPGGRPSDPLPPQGCPGWARGDAQGTAFPFCREEGSVRSPYDNVSAHLLPVSGSG